MGDVLLHLASYTCVILKKHSVSSEVDTAPITQLLCVVAVQFDNLVLENKVETVTSFI